VVVALLTIAPITGTLIKPEARRRVYWTKVSRVWTTHAARCLGRIPRSFRGRAEVVTSTSEHRLSDDRGPEGAPSDLVAARAAERSDEFAPPDADHGLPTRQT
jgi:hypothetical protein